MTSYFVGQRTREIGGRMALAAQRADILRLLTSQGMKLVGLGSAIGIAGALASARLLTALLYGIAPTDALGFAFTTVLLMAVACLACWLPARRAAKVDPMEALRYE